MMVGVNKYLVGISTGGEEENNQLNMRVITSNNDFLLKRALIVVASFSWLQLCNTWSSSTVMLVGRSQHCVSGGHIEERKKEEAQV